MLAYALYACVHFALQADVRDLLARVGDDASYYMTIARNVASGAGVTFDGIHRTNGFHPLWLLMLVPVFLLHQGPETMIRVVALLQTVLMILAYLVFLRTQVRLLQLPTAALSAALFVPLVFLPCINGMESALLVLMLVVLFSYGCHISQLGFDLRRAAVLGVIVGLVLLTRLDMIVIALAMAGYGARYALVRETRNRAVAMTLVCGLGVFVVVAPYLAFNYWKFDTVMPISGMLKSSFPHLALGADTLPRVASAGKLNLAFAGLALARAIWSITRIRQSPCAEYYGTAITIFAWAIALLFVCNVLFMKTGTFGWYYIPYRLFGVVLVTAWAHLALRGGSVFATRFWYGITAATLCCGVIVKEQAQERSPRAEDWHSAAYGAAVWAREHTPSNAVFAMSDCGHFAFFSMRRVINLDGLVNNMDFQNRLARHQLDNYLRQNRVNFLVQHAVHMRTDVLERRYDSLELYFPSWLFDGLGDSVTVRERNEVYRSSPYVDGPFPVPAVLVIWSLSKMAAVS